MHPLLWFAGGWLARGWFGGDSEPAPRRYRFIGSEPENWTCFHCDRKNMTWGQLLHHYVDRHPESGQAKSILKQDLLNRHS